MKLLEDLDTFPLPQTDEPEEDYDEDILMGSDELGENYNPRGEKFIVPLNNHRREKMHGYYELGKAGQFWYDSMFDDFLEMFKNKQDTELFIRMLAATSPNNAVETNVLYAFKAYAHCKLGKPIEKFDEARPAGFFKGFPGFHYYNISRACSGELLEGPKVSAFVAAMFGDDKAVVIDRWMIRAMGLKPQFGGEGTFKLKDGTWLKGAAEKFQGGFWVLPAYDSAIVSPALFAFDLLSSLKRSKNGAFYVPRNVIAVVKFPEKKLGLGAYNVLAGLTTRLATELKVPPRNYQAAVWTGIKIEQDPSGLENFVYYYRKHYGEDPPSVEQLERVAAQIKFIGEPEEDLPLMEFMENPNLPQGEVAERARTIEQAAGMLT